jgi:hypothetical protein
LHRLESLSSQQQLLFLLPLKVDPVKSADAIIRKLFNVNFIPPKQNSLFYSFAPNNKNISALSSTSTRALFLTT